MLKGRVLGEPTDSRLRVLVNAVSARLGGGATFASHQLAELAGIEGIDLTIYATGAVADDLARTSAARVVRMERRPLPLRLVWEQLVLARRARSYDVVYAIGNFGLLLANGPQVVALQNALHFGDEARAVWRAFGRLGAWRLAVEAMLARASVRRATTSVALSASLRDAVERDVGAAARVAVVPVPAPTLPAPKPIDGHGRYVLMVAHDLPHKEWDVVIDVFVRHPELPRLVLVGDVADRRRAAIEALVPRDRVELLGAVADRQLIADLYAAGTCALVHSRVESVGLTALEALVAGIPVVASDISAHREVCGGRATFYPADDAQRMPEAIGRALRQPRPEPLVMQTAWRDNGARMAAILRRAAGVRSCDDAA